MSWTINIVSLLGIGLSIVSFWWGDDIRAWRRKRKLVKLENTISEREQLGEIHIIIGSIKFHFVTLASQTIKWGLACIFLMLTAWNVMNMLWLFGFQVPWNILPTITIGIGINFVAWFLPQWLRLTRRIAVILITDEEAEKIKENISRLNK